LRDILTSLLRLLEFVFINLARLLRLRALRDALLQMLRVALLFGGKGGTAVRRIRGGRSPVTRMFSGGLLAASLSRLCLLLLLVLPLLVGAIFLLPVDTGLFLRATLFAFGIIEQGFLAIQIGTLRPVALAAGVQTIVDRKLLITGHTRALMVFVKHMPFGSDACALGIRVGNNALRPNQCKGGHQDHSSNSSGKQVFVHVR
jgi:hypothetical protein